MLGLVAGMSENMLKELLTCKQFPTIHLFLTHVNEHHGIMGVDEMNNSV